MLRGVLFRGIIAASFVALTSWVSPAAAVVQLAFVVDESGSVGSTNFGNMMQGIHDGLETHLPIDGSFEVTVIKFSSSTTLVFAPTLISNQGHKDALLNAILTAPYLAGSTNMHLALDLAVSEITGSVYFGTGASLINLATDGAPTNEAAATQAAIDARNAGITGLSAESIGAGGPTSYLASIVFPGTSPGTIVNVGAGDPVPNPINQGFVISIATFGDFSAAIDAKIEQTVAAATTEPGVLSMLGFGILTTGVLLRRRA